MTHSLLNLAEPEDYFSGLGKENLPTPISILLFTRKTKQTLQQEKIQNRSHHRFVLIFNVRTAGHVHVDNLELSFKPGQVIAILPYQFHHFAQLTSSDLLWLFCTFELKSPDFIESLRNRVVDIGEESNVVRDRLLKAWKAPSCKQHPEQLQSIALQLLISLKKDQLQTEISSCTDISTENLVGDINRLMHAWRGRPVAISDMVNALNYSESRLRVLFKEAAGIPLGRYIKNYRLNRAIALLRTTTFPISFVAEEAGFGSAQAFSRIFKENTGKTPSDYRKHR